MIEDMAVTVNVDPNLKNSTNRLDKKIPRPDMEIE